MYIKLFKVEDWMNTYETKAAINLGETCVDSLTVGNLLALCGEDAQDYLSELADVRLSYGHIEGSPELCEGIASLYQMLQPSHIIPMHGAIGANHLVLMSLIEPADNMVSVTPTYQQHYSIPASIGAEVRLLPLTPEGGFLPDIVMLKKLVDNNTKLITISNPNNPTGSLIPTDLMREIIKIAHNVGAFILCDEVYRDVSEDGRYSPSIVDLYDKGISVGSMSKMFSLAGLRLGWVALRDAHLRKACLVRREYDTISCGVLDDRLASLALNHKDKILARSREIIQTNREILHDWVSRTPQVHYQRPAGGTTALIYYKNEVLSRDLAIRLLNRAGVLVVPGICFEMEGTLRIGYAFDSKQLLTGLERIAEQLREIDEQDAFLRRVAARGN